MELETLTPHRAYGTMISVVIFAISLITTTLLIPKYIVLFHEVKPLFSAYNLDRKNMALQVAKEDAKHAAASAASTASSLSAVAKGSGKSSTSKIASAPTPHPAAPVVSSSSSTPAAPAAPVQSSSASSHASSVISESSSSSSSSSITPSVRRRMSSSSSYSSVSSTSSSSSRSYSYVSEYSSSSAYSSSSSSLSSDQASSVSASSSSIPTNYDIMLSHDETGKTYYGPASSDLERGNLLRQAVAALQNGDTLFLRAGTFDIDCKNKGNLRWPNNIAVSGAGMDATRLYGNCLSDDQGSAFEIRSGNFADLAFENQSWDVTEDGRTIEMYNGYKHTPDNTRYQMDAGNKVIEDANPGPFSAVFDRVKFIGTAWVVYDWSDRPHTWTIRDSVVVSGRQGISMMSGGGYTKNVTILRTSIDIDTMRTRDIGWTSNRNVGGGYAIVARGGNVTVTDSSFHMKCGGSPNVSSFVPRCVGIYDGNDFDSTSSPWTAITLNNDTWDIHGDFYGSGSPDTYDMFMTSQPVINRLITNGGTGSGPGGTLTKNW